MSVESHTLWIKINDNTEKHLEMKNKDYKD